MFVHANQIPFVFSLFKLCINLFVDLFYFTYLFVRSYKHVKGFELDEFY